MIDEAEWREVLSELKTSAGHLSAVAAAPTATAHPPLANPLEGAPAVTTPLAVDAVVVAPALIVPVHPQPANPLEGASAVAPPLAVDAMDVVPALVAPAIVPDEPSSVTILNRRLTRQLAAARVKIKTLTQVIRRTKVAKAQLKKSLAKERAARLEGDFKRGKRRRYFLQRVDTWWQCVGVPRTAGAQPLALQWILT